MKQLLTLLLALSLTAPLCAGNAITYKATSKLPETTSGSGLRTNAFNVSITSHTFSDGTGTITFSGEVTSIGDWAFYNCSSLTTITVEATVPPTCDLGEDSNYPPFKGLYSTATLYVPCQSLDAYKAHEEFGKFNNIQCIQGAKPVTVTLSSDCNKKRHKYDLRSGQVVDLSQPGGNISGGDDPADDFDAPARKTTTEKK